MVHNERERETQQYCQRSCPANLFGIIGGICEVAFAIITLLVMPVLLLVLPDNMATSELCG